MKSAFSAQSRAPRATFACAALFVALTIVGSVDVLARSYRAEAQLAAATRPLVVACNSTHFAQPGNRC